jgi:hypothetical protein
MQSLDINYNCLPVGFLTLSLCLLLVARRSVEGLCTKRVSCFVSAALLSVAVALASSPQRSVCTTIDDDTRAMCVAGLRTRCRPTSRRGKHEVTNGMGKLPKQLGSKTEANTSPDSPSAKEADADGRFSFPSLSTDKRLSRFSLLFLTLLVLRCRLRCRPWRVARCLRWPPSSCRPTRCSVNR